MQPEHCVSPDTTEQSEEVILTVPFISQLNVAQSDGVQSKRCLTYKAFATLICKQKLS